MKYVGICVTALVVMACGGAKDGSHPRLETKAQLQQRATDCATHDDGVSCNAVPDRACHWQEAACLETYPVKCIPARCIPEVTECWIVSSDGTETPCAQFVGADGKPFEGE